MIFSPNALQSCLPDANAGVWWIALSGGLDSCVLLDALVALQLPVTLRALHINHQISPNADAWQMHCAALCEQLNVPFTAVKVHVENTGRGIEDAARAARYAVFEQHITTGDTLLTAHHADDQTETMLLRLMRGTGPRGLAAMARTRILGQGRLHRPLLDFTRAELEGYASAHNLCWVDDESNSNDHYDRNFLRNQVIPLLRNRWPHVAQKWQQTAELCAANELLIEELAMQDMAGTGFQLEPIGSSLALGYLQHLSSPRRHNVLRYWLRGQGLSIPEQQHLVQIEQQIIHGRQDAETRVNWADVSLRVYRDRVFALPLHQLPYLSAACKSVDLPLAKQAIVSLPTGGQLQCEWVDIASTPLLAAGLAELHIRFRQGGERCRPVGRGHSQTLKRLLQDYHVPPWLRETLPLLYSGDTLVAVGDLWICEGYQSKTGGYRLSYHPKRS